MTLPLVSVIIPYHNHGEFLHSAVQSALRAASDLDVEIIVVNDGSPEPGAEAFLRNAELLSPHVRVIAKSNGGLSSARNAGLDGARGEFIQFLDSDDVLYPDKIALQVSHLHSRPDLIGSVTHYSLGDQWLVQFDTAYDSIGRFPLSAHSFLFLWERGFSVPIHTALFRAKSIGSLRFDTSVDGKEDWIFWASLLRQHPHALGYLPILGAVYRMHGQGMTKSPGRMGRSFLLAVDAIASLWKQEFPHFISASKAWYSRYYAPLIHNESLGAATKTDPIPLHSRDVAVISTNAAIAVDVLQTQRPRRKAFPAASGLIDIVIPVYNHFEYLEKCVESALSQEHIGQIIIVNDASTDHRIQPYLELIARRTPKVRYLRNRINQGISRSQNIAVAACEAPFVGFLDCDDYLEPGASQEMVKHMRAVEADYYFTDRKDVDALGETLRIAQYGGYAWLKPSGVIENDLVLGMVASHWKVIRRDLYWKLGGSSDEFSGIQDWAFALGACGVARFSYLPLPVYNHRIHGTAVTSSQSTSQIWKSNVARQQHLARTTVVSGTPRVVTRLKSYQQVERLVARMMRERRSLSFYDKARELSVHEIDLLREFNGLFERIEIRENAAAAMAGFVWDHRAIVLSNHPLERDRD